MKKQYLKTDFRNFIRERLNTETKKTTRKTTYKKSNLMMILKTQ